MARAQVDQVFWGSVEVRMEGQQIQGCQIAAIGVEDDEQVGESYSFACGSQKNTGG
jgi:hypothetical protein